MNIHATVTIHMDSHSPVGAAKECPSIHVYHVIVQNEKGLWPETFGSLDALNAYLRGLKAMSRVLGRHDIDIPEVTPRSGLERLS